MRIKDLFSEGELSRRVLAILLERNSEVLVGEEVTSIQATHGNLSTLRSGRRGSIALWHLDQVKRNKIRFNTTYGSNARHCACTTSEHFCELSEIKSEARTCTLGRWRTGLALNVKKSGVPRYRASKPDPHAVRQDTKLRVEMTGIDAPQPEVGWPFHRVSSLMGD